MALVDVNIIKEGGKTISEPIIATSPNMVIHVETEKPCDIALERSITGENFSMEGWFALESSKKTVVEVGISGCVTDQQLRLAFKGINPVVTKLSVLQ